MDRSADSPSHRAPPRSTAVSPPGVVLRELRHADLPILFVHQNDPEANRLAAFPPRDHEAFMTHWAKVLADESSIKRAIVLNGEVVGNVGCWQNHGRREVGYWIGRQHWGKGIATQALLTFLRQATSRPIHAHVAKHNRASIRVLEKCGFAITGEDRSAAPTGGEPVDEFIMTLC